MLHIIANFEIFVYYVADLDSVCSNVSVKLRVIMKIFRFYQRSTVRDSALRPQTLVICTGSRRNGICLAAAETTNERDVQYCLEKSVARADVVSQWSHNTGSIWFKVVSTANIMNYVG